jgi:hypothetical protein
MISMNPDPANPTPPRSLPGRVFDFLSGFGLATTLLLLLGVLTWLATLEQVDRGLYDTLNKYFDWKSVFLFPEIGGKKIPVPLPGGYWTCALLLLNLALGGIVRARKGWKHAGVLISHFGILIMLVAGGVTQHFSERGNLAVGEGETSDAAEDYFEHVVEVAEIVEGKPANIQVIRGEWLTDLEGDKRRTFRLPKFPFDLQLTRFHSNALPVAATERAPAENEPVVDGYFLMNRPGEKQAEANNAACYARVLHRDGSSGGAFILAGASFQPFTVRHDGRVFTVDMKKRLWPMPFQVRLDKFSAEFHPGTARAKSFESEITRLENGKEARSIIRMNSPMRYEGLTFFQASYGPPGAGPGQRLYSVFEVVRNPGDQWPKYSLYVVSFGLGLHFVLKLIFFFTARSRYEHRS